MSIQEVLRMDIPASQVGNFMQMLVGGLGGGLRSGPKKTYPPSAAYIKHRQMVLRENARAERVRQFLQEAFNTGESELKRDDMVEMNFESTTSTEKEVKCAVCQDDVPEGTEIPKIKCGHHFHQECLDEWCKYKQVCPVCKAELDSK